MNPFIFVLGLCLGAVASPKHYASPDRLAVQSSSNAIGDTTQHVESRDKVSATTMVPLAARYCNWDHMNPFAEAAGVDASWALTHSMISNPGSVETPMRTCEVAAHQLTNGGYFPSACLTVCNEGAAPGSHSLVDLGHVALDILNGCHSGSNNWVIGLEMYIDGFQYYLVSCHRVMGMRSNGTRVAMAGEELYAQMAEVKAALVDASGMS